MLRTSLAPILVASCSLLSPAAAAEKPVDADGPPAKLDGAPSGATCIEGCCLTPHLLVRREDALFHPVSVKVRHTGTPTELVVNVQGRAVLNQGIDADTTEAEFLLPATNRPTDVPVAFSTASGIVAEETVRLTPPRKLEIYLLPHSHVDIGYTKLQTKVERDHWAFIEQAIEAAQQPDAPSSEARFKWNVEVLWALDGYLRQASPDKYAALAEAIQRGQIGLDAFYCHELAGLCRPEELVQLLACSRRMSEEFGVPIESAMVTDCPGLTWGAVPVLAQSGVRYLSLGPNSGHRIGYTRQAWDNRPFWWVSPSGRDKILCWQTDNSYHPTFANSEGLRAFLGRVDDQNANYPYDILYYRQCKGDNQGPDLGLSEFVEEWNARYAYPRLIIATTTEAFRAFENRYGDAIPSVRGDLSPYWEDGAASSARETALNRATAERLVQAETLWAMLDADTLPAAEFDEAWRNVLLYDEHTWGARSYVNSGSSYPPGSPGYAAQWRIKQAFALDADAQSRELLERVLEPRKSSSSKVTAVDVLNTSSWPRSDLVVLPKDLRFRGEVVRDADGNEVAAQRLASGELAVLVNDVPAFGAARLTLHKGKCRISGSAAAAGNTLSNDSVQVQVDESTGAIRRLQWGSRNIELADPEAPGLNSYHYVPGFDPGKAATNGPVTVTVKGQGPLVASIVVASNAPGCTKLTREIRVVDGLNRVDIANRVDKKAIPLSDLLKKYPQKEGYHFGFAFNVPDGVMRVDMPWSVVRPEDDQLPGACKNWLSVQRWVDISNQDYGVTWATVDAPLVEVGVMSPQPRNPSAKGVWRTVIEPSATLYSYVMNNYWTTNYRHDQEGPITFRYAIQPHKRFDAGAAARFGTEQSQPLIVVPVEEDTPSLAPCLAVTPAGVVVTALKPIPGENAWLVRLFGASGSPEQATLRQGDGTPLRIWRSDLDGKPIEPIDGPIDVAPFEMVTVRIQGEAG
ncbi:MAG: hypothetical protein GY851_11025 [bacterium]|nr:hypothetical protein [bacterium]